LQNLLF
jgi:hypothetical protein